MFVFGQSTSITKRTTTNTKIATWYKTNIPLQHQVHTHGNILHNAHFRIRNYKSIIDLMIYEGLRLLTWTLSILFYDYSFGIFPQRFHFSFRWISASIKKCGFVSLSDEVLYFFVFWSEWWSVKSDIYFWCYCLMELSVPLSLSGSVGPMGVNSRQ